MPYNGNSTPASCSESRHNLIYWRYGDYAGIGPGAHGRLTFAGVRLATDTPTAPGDWLHRVEQLGNGERPRAALTQAEAAAELLMFGLRLTEGLDLDRYAAVAGTSVPVERIERLEELEMVRREGRRLCATDAGRAVLNAVIRELMA